MFTLTAIPVKFASLLVLFLFSTLWESRALATAKGAGRVSHGLHLLMALVMLVMVPRSVWRPLVKVVPLWVFIALMAIGVVWFAWQAIQAKPGHRAHAAGCTLMFAAMVWHLVGMSIKMHTMASMPAGSSMSPMPSMSAMASMGATPSASATSVTGMDHSSAMASGHSGAWWIAIVGLPLMAWLLWAGLSALVRAARSSVSRPSDLNDFAMNFGMFWMSTGLMVTLIPAFAHLSF